MKREDVRAGIEKIGIIPRVRVSSAELAVFAADSVNEAGLPVAEITMTVPNAVEVLTQLAEKYPGFIVGAGTVLDVETAKECLDAGTRFLTSPGLVPEVVEFALKNDMAVILRDLKVGLPQVPLIVSDGANQTIAASFILAGASALGIGWELLPPEALQCGKSWLH